MLTALDIRNIALIDRLTLALSPGLNVLTGETGAGKTIIIDALDLALGGRADRELIRTGAEQAEVQALFDVGEDEELSKMLDEMGAECEGGQLMISRQLSASGRNVCRVGDRLVSLGQLRQITACLVEMHGQHEHQSLTDQRQQLRYLDSFAHRELDGLKADVARQYAVWRDLRSRIRALNVDERESARRIELLRFEQRELEALKLKPGEDERIEARLAEMRGFEKTSDALAEAYAALDGDSSSALDQLRRAVGAMERISDMGEGYEQLSARLSDMLYQLEDAAFEAHALRSSQDFDPQLMERMESRLSALNAAKARYGPTLGDVIAKYEGIGEELEQIADGKRRLKVYVEQLKKEQSALIRLCEQLTQARRAAAVRFAAQVKGHLQDLGMAKVEFGVEVQEHRQASALSPLGWDTVEFTMSANAGEAPRPLSRIASGGELSRTMLALKAIAADADSIGTMIFDEIDTGISGRITQAVGEKLASIARTRQVIAITHQAQLAALADAQYLVEKRERDGRVYTQVRELNEDERVLELARIMGGDDDASLNHARSMFAAARERREALRREE
ncbi:MAG: DNA repair protein RecN [Candidatus Fimadaptatus sp.]